MKRIEGDGDEVGSMRVVAFSVLVILLAIVALGIAGSGGS